MNRYLPVEEKLSRARTQLLLNQPFFGTLCLRLKLVSMPSFPTMATDGRRLAYNPAFVKKLTPAELQGVLAHEVMHCALAHHCRRGEREGQLWNQATDYAINPILISNGITLPNDALLNPSFTDLGAEEIYARLLKQAPDSASAQSPSQSSAQSSGTGNGSNAPGQTPPSTPQQPPQSSPPQTDQQPQLPGVSDQSFEARAGGFGEVLDAVGEDDQPTSPAELSRQMHEWAISTEQALCSAKACGHEPGGIERPLEQARQSDHDWRAILREFIAATNPSDYRWAPPNRRFVSSGLYLPSVERSGVGEILIVDTSGSIETEELEQFAGEITAINAEAQPELIRVVYCDAAVQSVEEFGPSEPINLSPRGGGGTDFVPPFKWAEENGILPKCLIYLTDLCCNSFPEPPDYPVLWVTDSHRRAPFGETLQICVAA